jgi:SAM-dependent methyltransferase
MSGNDDQRVFWRDDAGPKWARHAGALDVLMQPVLDGVFARASMKQGQRVLDVGCGTGASTLQAAALVAPGGSAVGADISATLLGAARDAAAGVPNVTFVEADAAANDFGGARFDHLISRFGVMFFADPVAAFANMARALTPGARVTFAAWGQIPNNPFFTCPAQAARAVIGAPPKSDPDAPGPFAFRDPERVTAILREAGLQDVSCEVAEVALTPQGDPAAFSEVCLAIGPGSVAIRHFASPREQVEALRARIEADLATFDTPEGLRIPAEINFFTARAPRSA